MDKECHVDQKTGRANKGEFVKFFPSGKHKDLASIMTPQLIDEMRDVGDQVSRDTGIAMVTLGLHVYICDYDKLGRAMNHQPRVFYIPGRVEITSNDPGTRQTMFGLVTKLQNEIEMLANTVGSGFTIESIEHLKITYEKKRGLWGSKFIPLPTSSHRESLLNIKNEDELCLLYCILAQLFPQKGKKCQRENPQNYEQYLKHFVTKDLKFPLKSNNELVHFWSQNKHLNCDISIYKYHEEDVVPIFSTRALCGYDPTKYLREHVQLLQIEGFGPVQNTGEGDREHRSHYVLIENFHTFARKHYRGKTQGRDGRTKTSTDSTYRCPICVKYGTRTLPQLEKHIEGCKRTGTGQVKYFPTGDDAILKFGHTKAQFQPCLLG